MRRLLSTIFMDFISCLYLMENDAFLRIGISPSGTARFASHYIDKLNRNRSLNLLGLNLIVGSQDKQKNLLFSLFFHLIFVWTDKNVLMLFKLRTCISNENRLCIIIWSWDSLNLIRSMSLYIKFEKWLRTVAERSTLLLKFVILRAMYFAASNYILLCVTLVYALSNGKIMPTNSQLSVMT